MREDWGSNKFIQEEGLLGQLWRRVPEIMAHKRCKPRANGTKFFNPSLNHLDLEATSNQYRPAVCERKPMFQRRIMPHLSREPKDVSHRLKCSVASVAWWCALLLVGCECRSKLQYYRALAFLYWLRWPEHNFHSIDVPDRVQSLQSSIMHPWHRLADISFHSIGGGGRVQGPNGLKRMLQMEAVSWAALVNEAAAFRNTLEIVRLRQVCIVLKAWKWGLSCEEN